MFAPAIAIHCGVGFYDSEFRNQTQILLDSTLSEAQRQLNSGGQTALDVCCDVSKLLEDSPLTNAGIGANLTNQGTVELDATVMMSEPLLFGSVGALPGFKNPILVARKLLDLQRKARIFSDLLPACFLAGESASDWCLKVGFSACNQLITDDALNFYQKALKLQVKRKTDVSFDAEPLCKRMLGFGTVGAVVVDKSGLVCAGTSSGGIILKEPGRVGSSAMYGAGCWAETKGKCRIAVSCSGEGEFLIWKLFSSRLCEAILSNSVDSEELLAPVFERCFEKVSGLDAKCAAAICVRAFEDEETEVCWGTNSYSFPVGFVGANNEKQSEFNEAILNSSNERKLSVTSHLARNVSES